MENESLVLYFILSMALPLVLLLAFGTAYSFTNKKDKVKLCRHLIYATPLYPFLIPVGVTLGLSFGLLYVLCCWLPDQFQNSPEKDWKIELSLENSKNSTNTKQMVLPIKRQLPAPKETVAPVKPKPTPKEVEGKRSFKEAFTDNNKKEST